MHSELAFKHNSFTRVQETEGTCILDIEFICYRVLAYRLKTKISRVRLIVRSVSAVHSSNVLGVRKLKLRVITGLVTLSMSFGCPHFAPTCTPISRSASAVRRPDPWAQTRPRSSSGDSRGAVCPVVFQDSGRLPPVRV